MNMKVGLFVLCYKLVDTRQHYNDVQSIQICDFDIIRKTTSYTYTGFIIFRITYLPRQGGCWKNPDLLRIL